MHDPKPGGSFGEIFLTSTSTSNMLGRAGTPLPCPKGGTHGPIDPPAFPDHPGAPRTDRRRVRQRRLLRRWRQGHLGNRHHGGVVRPARRQRPGQDSVRRRRHRAHGGKRRRRETGHRSLDSGHRVEGRHPRPDDRLRGARHRWRPDPGGQRLPALPVRERLPRLRDSWHLQCRGARPGAAADPGEDRQHEQRSEPGPQQPGRVPVPLRLLGDRGRSPERSSGPARGDGRREARRDRSEQRLRHINRRCREERPC